MRRIITAVLIVAALGAASWIAYGQIGGARAAKAPDYEVVDVTRGNITSTVSATGSVLPEREASLSFQTTGTVEKVLVKEGDLVFAGQVLAQLNTRDLDLAVRQAEASVQTAEAQLRELQEKPSPVDVAAAEAQVASAKASYERASQGGAAQDRASARAAVQSAQAAYDAAVKAAGTSDSQLEASAAALAKTRAALEQAQAAYDQVKGAPNVGMLPQSLQLQQATIDFEQAKANYDALAQTAESNAKSKVDAAVAQLAQAKATQAGLSPTTQDVTAAEAQVAQAQANLDKLQRGPTQAQIDSATANVRQARLSLEQAQHRVEDARVTAPWDGVVTAVNVVEGAPPAAGSPAFEIADVSLYHINVRVDEADIASIAENQPVSIELDAFAGQNLSGHVAKVAPAAASETTAGVVTYQVRIDIEPSNLQLRTGMSATASITSNSRENVLLVPNRAIQVDRESGKTFLERLAGDVPEKVEVRLGLRNDQVSEVRDGLTDGDQVVIRQLSSRERLQQTMRGG